MNAKDIMSTQVVTTDDRQKLAHIKDLFTRHKIGSVPVLRDNGELLGIITSADVSAIHNEDLLVRNIMTHRTKVCAMNARVIDLARTMVNEQIHHIVVMEDGAVKGMISSLDVIKGLIDSQA